MTTRRLYEAGKLVEGKTSRGTWPIRIITEGKGSSGNYLREMLEQPENHIFGNRPMFGNHPADPSKPWERSPFDIKAKLGPAVEYKVVDGVAGIYGEAIVSPEVDQWLEEFHDVIGVSIFASGEGHEDENGEWIVESFDGSDPYTSVDFVVAPGRGGAVEARMLEAYRAIETSTVVEPGSAPAASQTKENKEQSMEISELAEKVDTLTEAVAALTGIVTPLAESLKPEDAPEVDVAAAIESAIDKAEEADIPKELRGPILEAAKAGEDVDAAVATQKAVVEAVKARITESHDAGGRFGGSGTVEDAAAYVPKGF
jgi:hypothetical protein